MTEAGWQAPSRRRVLRIRDRLREVYGIPCAPPHRDPIAELILTVLSQSTNDRNRDVAYLALRSDFPSWEAVRDAPVELVEQAIRPGGISKVKSARIKAILQAITETGIASAAGPAPAPAAGPAPAPAAGPAPAPAAGPAPAPAAGPAPGPAAGPAPGPATLSLDWLADQPVPEAQRYLVGLPGVGRKTAACVLLFSFGMHDVPVDTHVSRVGTRLGLFRPRAAFEELHDTMLAITPRGQELEFHINLLRHGRRTCVARRPACGECALLRMCPQVGVSH